jgi:hypothetical protein
MFIFVTVIYKGFSINTKLKLKPVAKKNTYINGFF